MGKRFKLVSGIIVLCLLCGCSAVEIKEQQPTTKTYYKSWCSTCGNKGWVDCDICYNGKMVHSDYKCWKCNGMGKLKCPTCFGTCNSNGEWK